jgi:hypothetical protein
LFAQRQCFSILLSNLFRPNAKIVDIRVIIEIKRSDNFSTADPGDDAGSPARCTTYFFKKVNSFFPPGMFLDISVIYARFVEKNNVFHFFWGNEFPEFPRLGLIPFLYNKAFLYIILSCLIL